MIGIGYSGLEKNRGPKRFVGFKTAITGLGWGMPVLLPNGAEGEAWWLVLLVGVQVFLGSVLRDIGDANEGARDGLITLADRWGRRLTYKKIHSTKFNPIRRDSKRLKDLLVSPRVEIAQPESKSFIQGESHSRAPKGGTLRLLARAI